MLSRESRASSSTLALLSGGKVIRTKHLLFSYVAAPGAAASRLACSVAKKVAKRAVDRNRLKRQCRAGIREALPTLKKPIVGIIRVMDARVSWSEIQMEVREAFTKAE